MTQNLHCHACKKLTIKIEHAFVRNGVVTFCRQCAERVTVEPEAPEAAGKFSEAIHGFMAGLRGGKR